MTNIRNDFTDLTDEELIFLIKHKDADPYRMLFERYKPLYNRLAHKYKIRGYDVEDLYQEAWIVIVRSVQRYDPASGLTLGQYLRKTIDYEYQNILRKDSAIKRKIDKQAKSLDAITEVTGDTIYGDSIYAVENSYYYPPDHHAMVNEIFDTYEDKLSPFESKVLKRYLKQITVEDIAEELACSSTKVTNAIDRCKLKLREMARLNRKKSY